MKRQVITIQEDAVIYAPHQGEVWMTIWEIAELMYKTIRKLDAMIDAEFEELYIMPDGMVDD